MLSAVKDVLFISNIPSNLGLFVILLQLITEAAGNLTDNISSASISKCCVFIDLNGLEPTSSQLGTGIVEN